MNMIRRLLRWAGNSAAPAAAGAALLIPLIASAQCASSGSSNGLQNPTCFPDIQSFIAAFLQAVVQISLPIITLFIVYAGFLFITARGNPEKLSKARMNLLYVIIGAILILGAWILATLIGSTVSQVVGSGS
jgi:hypothetical protein